MSSSQALAGSTQTLDIVAFRENCHEAEQIIFFQIKAFYDYTHKSRIEVGVILCYQF